MIHFKAVRKNLRMCSYYPNQTRVFDTKRLMISFMRFLVVVSFFKFFIDDADNMADYVYSAYFTATTFGIFCSFLHTSSKTSTIFILIDTDVGKVIKEGKSIIDLIFWTDHKSVISIILVGLKCPTSKKMYIKTNGLVEKISKILEIGIVKVTPSVFTLPKALLCYFTYFTTDSGADAFELPLPMW